MSTVNDKIDQYFDKIFSNEFGSDDVNELHFASEIDAAFEAIYNESAKSLEEENEALTILNFELLAEKQEAEKREADLLEKLQKATVNEQASSDQIKKLREELVATKEENETLKSTQLRTPTYKRTAEESKIEKVKTGAELFLAKKSMLRSVSMPVSNMKDTVDKPTEPEHPKSKISTLKSAVPIPPATSAPCETKKEELDEKPKAKKERRSSIFANLAKRRKDNDRSGKSDKEKKSGAGGLMKK